MYIHSGLNFVYYRVMINVMEHVLYFLLIFFMDILFIYLCLVN
jgi:hypothetical protein